MLRKKFDSTGEYTSYPGITIVAKVLPAEANLSEELYSALNNDPLISKYYAMLLNSTCYCCMLQ